MNHFKTSKGTELPFLNLKGKDYLQVAHRILWFREEHPDWSLITEIIKNDEIVSVVIARVLDAQGRVLSVGHKSQTAQGFAAPLEKAESGAIGRALAFLGYGTANAQELDDEGPETPLNELPDSPMPPRGFNNAFPGSKTRSPSEAQLKRLFAIAKSKMWQQSEVGRIMADKFQVKQSSDLTIPQYNELCDYLENNNPMGNVN